MCTVPKFSLIDLLCWFHLFLNYLYLVALLNLKVSCVFMFCYSMRDKLKTICYVFHMIWNTHVTFIVSLFMIFCLCSSSCYNMVAKFLIIKIMSFMPMVWVLLIPALNAYFDDQDCDDACHLKNYSFVITYLLKDAQELSLGMLDTSQTYLLFLMLHACSFTICLVFCYTSWHFYAFSGTNLLTRYHSASSLFSTVFVFQKSYIRNILGIGWNKSQTFYFYRSFEKTEDDTEGSQRLATP
jgi:hypothetical protein